MQLCAESARVAPWAADPVSRQAWWSDLFFVLLGYDRGDFENTSSAFRALIHPDDRDASISSMERLVAGDIDAYHATFRLRRKDGEWHWFESSARMANRQAGCPLICGGLRDIHETRLTELERERLIVQTDTARAESQSALENAEQARSDAKASEGMLKLAVEFGNQAAWSNCRDTGEAWLMDAGYKMLGYSPEEFAADAKAWQDITHPDDLEEANKRLGAFFSGKSNTFDHILRLRHKDGSYHWYRIMSRQQDRSDQDLPPLVAGMIISFDDFKATEERLSEALSVAEQLRTEAQSSEKKLRIWLAAGEQLAWTLGEEEDDCFLAEGGYELLGYTRDELTPNREGWRSLTHPEDFERTISKMISLANGETDMVTDEHRLLHKDGTYHWYRIVAHFIDRSDEGLPPLRAGTSICIDELKENEERLSKALELAERMRAEAKASEEMLRISLSAGDQLAWNMCLGTGKGSLSEEGFALLGYDRDAFTPNHEGWRDLIHPDDLEVGAAMMEQLLSGQIETYRHEHRLRHKNGEYHWYRGVARVIDRSDRGLPDLLAGTLVGIDMEKQRELRLAEAVKEAEAARSEAQQTADILRVSSENSGVVPWFRIPDTDEFWFNANISGFLGLPPDTKVTLEDWLARIHPADLPKAGVAIEAIETFKTDEFAVEIRIRGGDDKYFWARSVGRRIRREEQGLPDLICGAQFSIDEIKKNEMRQEKAARQLQDANDRLTTIANNAPAGIFEYRRGADGSFGIPYASTKFCDMLGLSQDEIAATPKRAFERVHKEDLAELLSSIDVSAERLESWNRRYRIIHPDRGTLWLTGSSTPRKLDDGSISWIGVMTDITDHVKRETALKEAHLLAEQMRLENERLALHDALTGLPNRRFFDQVFQGRLDQAESAGPRDACLIRIDLDKFKYINDTLGHEAGDLALKHFASAMKDSVRGGDFVTRIGGDEFSILLSPGSGEDAAKSLVERMRARLEEPLSHSLRSFHIRASFGVAYAENILDYGRDLQFFADKALYAAKDSGRNQTQFFTPDLHKGILDERGLGADLQEALGTDQFVPFFQPQVCARTGDLVGVETLLRWNHPERGLLTPDKFMRLAEQMRIMPEIDKQTYRSALELVRNWEAMGFVIPKISFNISSGRMRDTAILEDTENWDQTQNAKITFELLESIVVEEESAEFNANLEKVRARGIDVEIDDFGSGHASIISLLAIEPSALKVDRRLVRPIAQDRKYLDLIRGIVGIAQTLGVTTIAEGVETEEQARLLSEIGCGAMQGYLFAPPLSPTDFRAFLAGDITDSDGAVASLGGSLSPIHSKIGRGWLGH